MRTSLHLTFTVLALVPLAVAGQNLFTNASFENYTTCPTALGQVANCYDWSIVVESSDYYNCGYTNPSFFPISGGAYDGTGFMGFASYGNANGAAEAIGQNLGSSWQAGFPRILSFAAKMTTGGGYASVCGGLAVYGFPGQLPASVTGEHPSSLPGAQLLMVSETISSTDWDTFSAVVVPTENVGSIVFTNEYTVNCGQYFFLDGVSLTVEGGITGIGSHSSQATLTPGAMEGTWTLTEPHGAMNWLVVDGMGKVVASGNASSTSALIDLSGHAKGVYVLNWFDGQQVLGTRRVIR